MRKLILTLTVLIALSSVSAFSLGIVNVVNDITVTKYNYPNDELDYTDVECPDVEENFQFASSFPVQVSNRLAVGLSVDEMVEFNVNFFTKHKFTVLVNNESRKCLILDPGKKPTAEQLNWLERKTVW